MLRKPDVLAMVLAGGRVDELDVLTFHRPKSAVPFGGFARVIDFALSNLMHSGLERVAVLSQYRSFSLINHIGNGMSWDMVGRNRGIHVLPPFIDHNHSHWYRGTADAVSQNIDFIDYFDPELVLVLSGDHIYKMDYRRIIAYHRQKKADLTMACTLVSETDACRFGVATIDDEDGELGGRVTSYEEKSGSRRGRWASLTILCCNRRLLMETLAANQSEDSSFEFGRDIIPRLLREKRRIYGYKFHGYWGYTRTVDEYWQTNMDMLGDRPRLPLEEWGVRTNLDHRGIRDCQPLHIGGGTVVNSLVYNGGVIDGHVENSVLFPGVHVAKGATVRDSVLFFNARVDEGARLCKVISDVNNHFGRDAVLGDPVESPLHRPIVVGWNNHVPAGTVIEPAASIAPALAPERWREHISCGESLR